MVVRDRFLITDERLAELCQRYHVRGLALYGSVLREDFRDDSDIDVLVEFEPDTRISLFDLSGLQRELEDAFGRKVDLVERRSLHPLNRDNILAQARSIRPEWQVVGIEPARPFRREWLQLHMMIEAADALARMLVGQTRETIIASNLRRSALVVPLARIGWLAGRLPENIRVTYSDVDWDGWEERVIRLTTQYWDIDWNEVWTMAADAPQLRERILVILANEFPVSSNSQHNDSCGG